MRNKINRCLNTAWQRSVHLALSLTVVALSLAHTAETRWERARASGDRGSESVEKAVLVAIGLAIAIGLGFAIRAAVQNYQNQIK
ncbi:hypothetical protein ACPZ19_04800 [Amycolatopsis lurida]